MDDVNFYNRELETLERERLRRLQDEKLRRLMNELATNYFYQERFQAAGIKPTDVREFEEAANKIDARGELIITNLGRAGMPLLRYRTGDLVEVSNEPCACGRSFARIKGGVIGRADDMLIVRGVNLYPSAIDNLLRSLPRIIEYEVLIRRVGGLDDLLIKIETDDAQSFAEIERATLEAFRTQFAIRVSIEQAERGSLPRYEFKARRYKRIVD